MINKTAASIFAIVASIGMLTVSSTIAATMQPAHALTRFFNCTTQVANSTHHLTFQDVNACYSKEFHSSRGVGTGTTITTGSGVHGNSTPHHHGFVVVVVVQAAVQVAAAQARPAQQQQQNKKSKDFFIPCPL